MKLTNPRVIAHTLAESDLDESDLDWMGSPERNQFVWKPQMSRRDYMLGLIRCCDRAGQFVFGIRKSASQQLVGYRKVQILTEDNGRGAELTAIPTTVIGDAWAGQAYGQEAGMLVNWFLVQQVKVRAVSPRIYEKNERTWRLVESLGYRLVRRFEEKSSQGSATVRLYTKTAEELEESWTQSVAQFQFELGV